MERKCYKNRVRKMILAVMVLVMFLTGCGKAEKPQMPIGETIEEQIEEAMEETIEEQGIMINMANMTDTENAIVEENGEEAIPEKKTLPEGFELKLDSEEWGLYFEESGTQPRGNAAAADMAWYDAYYVGSDSEMVVYLTFDCGYENGNTEPIMEALKKHDAPATFFVTGHFLETEPDLVKKMVEEGYAVGNHTYHHPDMASIADIEAFQKELDDVGDLFYEITGTELSQYYRPPQGKCNAENMKMAQELGYCTIFWSLAYVDWDTEHQPSYTEAINKLTERVHPGAVVLLHNTSQTNGEILDELLTKWEEMGYTFKPLSDLTGSGEK